MSHGHWSWCPGDAKVGVRIGTNSDTNFDVLGTLTVFTVYTKSIAIVIHSSLTASEIYDKKKKKKND